MQYSHFTLDKDVAANKMKVLREESLFSDVTLLCDDVSLVAAHKIVLAAHSDTFEQMLTQEMTESPSPSLRSTEPPVAWLTSYTRARPASAGWRCSRCRAEQIGGEGTRARHPHQRGAHRTGGQGRRRSQGIPIK